jgi:succinate dehydrogenase / fumarate reductase cytochrome b subunit
MDMGYVATIDGQQVRDLKRLLVETFQSPIYTFAYVLIMLLLGFHLRHGVWSAMQSLGAMTPRLTPVVYTIGGIIGLGIAVGFLVLPLWIFFGG